jgi:hypothetical protein
MLDNTVFDNENFLASEEELASLLAPVAVRPPYPRDTVANMSGRTDLAEKSQSRYLRVPHSHEVVPEPEPDSRLPSTGRRAKLAESVRQFLQKYPVISATDGLPVQPAAQSASAVQSRQYCDCGACRWCLDKARWDRFFDKNVDPKYYRDLRISQNSTLSGSHPSRAGQA